MKTTPTGELRKVYRKLTKGQLFYTALGYYQLQNTETIDDLKEFVKFCKKETRLFLDKEN